jgi:hypothetical protein
MEGLLGPRPDFMHSETRGIVENALASEIMETITKQKM